jgi:hypothetical protein
MYCGRATGKRCAPACFNATVIESESPSISNGRTASTEFNPIRAEAPAVKIQ